jgi:hypothetical protein
MSGDGESSISVEDKNVGRGVQRFIELDEVIVVMGGEHRDCVVVAIHAEGPGPVASKAVILGQVDGSVRCIIGSIDDIDDGSRSGELSGGTLEEGNVDSTVRFRLILKAGNCAKESWLVSVFIVGPGRKGVGRVSVFKDGDSGGGGDETGKGNFHGNVLHKNAGYRL